MTTLTFEKITLPSAQLGGESSLPPLAIKQIDKENEPIPCFAEDEGLYVNYGETIFGFPYRAQDMYDRELKDREYDSAILENDYLKATFLPQFGGKLWSLIDKTTGKELLFRNDVVRPCNLAIRNAWTSGGVEWNMGVVGHSPMTCSLVNTARTQLEDGTPVLRFYWFERIRCCIAQMDFFLPEDSKNLFVRTRITNPNEETTPMYWWSNIAAGQDNGVRVVVPAEEAYLAESTADSLIYRVASIPQFNGVDVTYPLRSPNAYDYFWKVKGNGLRYICQLDKDGYGLATSATDMLRGRKLFVWGDTQGGRRWQNFLTADDQTGSYCEIQVGLARTQLECVPMPPRTVWEWVETYGAMQADKEKIHGSWTDARAEVEGIFAQSLTKDFLEKLLDNTRTMAKSQAQSVYQAEGWAELENLRRKASGERGLMCDHLQFAATEDAQEAWIRLLDEGTVGQHDPREIPVSYQSQAQWLQLLRKAIADKDQNNWYAYYLLGTAEAAKLNYPEAKELLQKSMALQPSAWAGYVLAIVAQEEKDNDACIRYIVDAFKLRNDDISLAREVFRCLYQAQDNTLTVKLFERAAETVKKNPRCIIFYAYALARCGQLDKAEKLLVNNGKYLVVPDIREAETMTSDLWVYINKAKGISEAEMGEPPRELDFRMLYNNVKEEN